MSQARRRLVRLGRVATVPPAPVRSTGSVRRLALGRLAPGGLAPGRLAPGKLAGTGVARTVVAALVGVQLSLLVGV